MPSELLFTSDGRCGGGVVPMLASLYDSKVFDVLDAEVADTYASMFAPVHLDADNSERAVVQALARIITDVELGDKTPHACAREQLSALVSALNASSKFDADAVFLGAKTDIMSQVAKMRKIQLEQSGTISNNSHITSFQLIVDCATSAMGDEADIAPWAQRHSKNRTRSTENDWHSKSDDTWDNFQLRRHFSMMVLKICDDSRSQRGADKYNSEMASSVPPTTNGSSSYCCRRTQYRRIESDDDDDENGVELVSGARRNSLSILDSRPQQQKLGMGRRRTKADCKQIIASLCSIVQNFRFTGAIDEELVFASLSGALLKSGLTNSSDAGVLDEDIKPAVSLQNALASEPVHVCDLIVSFIDASCSRTCASRVARLGCLVLASGNDLVQGEFRRIEQHSRWTQNICFNSKHTSACVCVCGCVCTHTLVHAHTNLQNM